MKQKTNVSPAAIFFILFFFFLISPILCFITEDFINSINNPFDYARITDVDYKAVVCDEEGSKGKVIITERLTFDVHAASKDNLFWELWRDLPENEVDGVKVRYKVNSVKQILEDGTELLWEESPKLYWDDSDYVNTNLVYGPGKWFHSPGPYDEEYRRYECLLFYVDGLYREKVVFEIEYEMYNATLKYNDCSDLYLSLFSGESTEYLESYRAQILFPNKDMPSEGNYFYTTYGTDDYSFPVKESATANPGYYTFSFELDKDDLKFSPNTQYIEFDLVSYGDDKHIFTEYAPSNQYTSDDVLQIIRSEQAEYRTNAIFNKTLKIVTFVASLLLSAVTLILTLCSKWIVKSKYQFFQPATDIKYYRDIPSDLDPYFASQFVFCKDKAPKDDSCIYSAILLSLARKKYIALEEKNNNVYITIKKRTSNNPGNQTGSVAASFGTGSASDTYYEPLSPCEEYYYNLIIRHVKEGSIAMANFQDRVSKDYQNTTSFVDKIEKSVSHIGIGRGYFQKADYQKPAKTQKGVSTFMMVCGILSITFPNLTSYQSPISTAYGAFTILGITLIVCAIILRKQARKYVLLTQLGEDEYAKWRGLYHFLNSDTLIHERSYVELPIWEQYLVYATAFGLSEKIIKAIKLKRPQAANSEILGNPCYHSHAFYHSGRAFRSAVYTASHTASSSGGHGSFGYGGGGRGGGGGGGGH